MNINIIHFFFKYNIGMPVIRTMTLLDKR